MLLTLRNGPNQGQAVPIGDAPVIFGRQASATITLDDKKVSREHAVIEKSPDGACVLRDLESTNHTYLNGRPIRSAVLEDGDVIRIGGAEIAFAATSADDTANKEEAPVEAITPVSIANEIDAFIDEDSISLSLEISPQMIQQALRQEPSTDRGLQESLYALAQITCPETPDIELLEASIGIFAEAIDFDHWVWLEWNSDDDADYQVVVASNAQSQSIPCDRVEPSRSLLNSARRSNRCMVSEDISQDFEMSMALRADDVASALVVPVARREGSGALYLERTGARPPFTARDLER
ncbi:MAG: FHA domain-containing protein, partial [Planctomycetota bacterium]